MGHKDISLKLSSITNIVVEPLSQLLPFAGSIDHLIQDYEIKFSICINK